VDETWNYTATHTITQAEIDNNGGGDGNLENVATAHSNETPDDSDDATVPVVYNPDLSVTKVVSSITNPNATDGGTKVNEAGDVVHYTITVHNDGNVTLHNVIVSDSFVSSLGKISETGGTGVNGDGVLDVGETWTYEATHTVTQAEVDAGVPLVNTVEVDSDKTSHDDVDGDDTDSVAVDVEHPSYTLDKCVKKIVGGCNGKVDSAGDVIWYKVKIDNNGNVPITIESVKDSIDGHTPFDLTNVKGDTDGDGVLDPDETWTYCYKYTVTQDDIDSKGGGNCKIDNLVTVETGNAGDKTAATHTKLIYDPDFCITKKACVADGWADEVGEKINYTIKVANTGNVTLTGAKLTDYFVDQGSVFTTPTSGDKDLDGKLDVGECWVFKFTHTLTANEVKKGGLFINVATFHSDEAGDDSAYAVTKIYNNGDCGCGYSDGQTDDTGGTYTSKLTTDHSHDLLA
jgi:uncharacterized repeat protein (TIGR01451 family)